MDYAIVGSDPFRQNTNASRNSATYDNPRATRSNKPMDVVLRGWEHKWNTLPMGSGAGTECLSEGHETSERLQKSMPASLGVVLDSLSLVSGFERWHQT